MVVKTPVYLDYQATTPLDPTAYTAMLPYLEEVFGNPHSTTHAFGWRAEEGVEQGRAEIAALIGGRPEEITFTSGATEANNTIIKGLAHAYAQRRHQIIVPVTEHKCVLESARAMQGEGCEVIALPIGPNGLIDLDRLADAISPQTLLVSVMAVNNEIGVIHDLAAIGRICRDRNVLFHSDAAQALGKIPLDINEVEVDFLSLSGHKIYGPKGVGANW